MKILGLLLAISFFVLFQRSEAARRYHRTRLPIHLLGGSTKNEGYLGVFINQKWFYVCNELWDARNSKVVCRELGYSRVAAKLSTSRKIKTDVEEREFLDKEITCEGNERELGKCAQKDIDADLRGKKCGLKSRLFIRCSSTKNNDVTKRPTQTQNLRLHTDDDVNIGNFLITSGRLQVLSEDEWTDFCSEYWGETNSKIACLQLGFPSFESFHSSSPKMGSARYFNKVINCTGKESVLQECPSWSLTQSCSSVVLLKCKLPNKNDVIKEENGELRLRGGDNAGSGRVEIFRDQRWGTVCDDNWDLRDANIVCRQLGFGSAFEATHWAEHGEGVGKILLTDVNCKGNETALQNCRGSPNTQKCTHSEDAGVRCHVPEYAQKKRLKLVGGDEKSGRLDVYKDGNWFGICGIGFTQREGTVACRQLGLGFVHWAGKSYDYGINYRKIMYDVQCSGNEKSLFDCKYKTYSQCRYYDMASVICAPYAPDLLMDIAAFKKSIKVESHTLYELRCSYEERCLAPIVDSYYQREKHRKRHLLKFTSRFVNKGTISFRPNTDKTGWKYHGCHGHYHSMETFAQYDIIDRSGTRVADGHKASFCLEDSECDSGYKKVFNCTDKGDQGISVNCADNYKNTIDCQWIDITELHYGNYSLRVEVNPSRLVAESDWLNNRAVCEVEYSEKTLEVKHCSNDPCFQESFGGNAFGHCCHFPFVFNGKLHYACVEESNDRPWCSTTVDYDADKKWGYCSERKKSNKSKFDEVD